MALVAQNEFQTLSGGDRMACEVFVRQEYAGLRARQMLPCRGPSSGVGQWGP
jgi:hypothetical protein